MSLVPLHVISLTVKDNFCRRKRSFKPCKSEHDSVKDHHRGKHTHTQKPSTCRVDPKIQVKVLLHVSTLRKSWPRKAKDRKRRTGSEMYKSRLLCVTFKSKNWQFCFLLFQNFRFYLLVAFWANLVLYIHNVTRKQLNYVQLQKAFLGKILGSEWVNFLHDVPG